MFGLVGGPLIIISGALVILDAIPAGGAVQALMTIPEFIWELSIGIYLIVKGYRTSSPALVPEVAASPTSAARRPYRRARPVAAGGPRRPRPGSGGRWGYGRGPRQTGGSGQWVGPPPSPPETRRKQRPGRGENACV
jgi:hypothetical protein